MSETKDKEPTMLGKILFLLTPKEKRRGALVLGMVVIMAGLEVAGVASVMPFLTVLGDPEMVQTNPILAATDGVIVANQASAVLMVLRANITTEKEARSAIRRLDQNGIRPTGLIVNDFDAKREAYGQYYYQYSYRSAKT